VLQPTAAEIEQRGLVLQALREAVAADRTIHLPRASVVISPDFALLALASDPGIFGGVVGPHRYLFEGEDDLLHLVIVRADGHELSVEEAQEVVTFLISQVPSALIWVKPGTVSQHFYLAHDLLLD
jgi:hypothetical protein